MRMIIAALIGGAVLGFVDAQFIVAQVQKLFADPGTQSIASAGVAAFLGALWGWIARGTMGAKSKE